MLALSGGPAPSAQLPRSRPCTIKHRGFSCSVHFYPLRPLLWISVQPPTPPHPNPGFKKVKFPGFVSIALDFGPVCVCVCVCVCVFVCGCIDVCVCVCVCVC